MKKLTLTSVLAIAIIISAFLPRQASAQAPQAFKYQAVVRDNTGEIISNQTVSFRISIRAGSALGFIVYQETHSVTTNDFGLANLEIGNGTPVSDLFVDIDWTSGSKYLETELDPANGNSYISLGTTQLLSVPFALYAENARSSGDDDWTEFGANLYNNNTGNVGIGTTSPGAKLEVAGRISQTGTGYSVFLGEYAGANDDLLNNYNTFIGRFSGYQNTNGNSNLFFGQGSGFSNTTGSNNSFIGFQSGHENLTGTDNVFLGYMSGYNETGSNKLYIENSTADKNNALIYGEFDNDILAINGNVGIGTTTPSSTLEVNGNVSANAFFGDGSGLTGIQDGHWIKTNNYIYNLNDSVGIGTSSPSTSLEVIGDVTANAFYGDGTNLTGINTNQVWDTTGTNIYNINAGSVGIGVTNPDSSAILEIASTNKGLLIPRIADTDLIESPVEGLLIFDSGSKYLKYYNGNIWTFWGDPSTGPWQCGETLNDERDGQEYKTTQIGNLCWMAENLNIGIMLPGLHTDNGIIEKRCYDNDIGACTVYGGLYTWNEIMEYSTTPGIQGICPEGWHIPTDFEWKYLEGTVDSQYGVGDPIWDQTSYRGYDVATNLRSQTGWILINGEDLYDFNALPAGTSYHYNPPSYADLGYDAYFWTSLESNNDDSWARRFGGSQSSRWDYDKSYFGFSVRCVKD